MPFDPSKPFEIVEPTKPKSKTGTGEAISRGIEEGASLGLAKTSRGASGALYEAINPEPEQSKVPFVERFTSALIPETEREREKVKEISKDRPVAFNLSKGIAGLVPLAPTLAAGAIPTIAAGAGAGTIDAISEEKNPAIGAAFGAGGAAIGLGAAKGLSSIGKILKESARESVVGAVKFAPTTMRRLAVRGDVLGKVKEIADDLVDQKITNNPKTMRQVYDKTASVLKANGKVLGEAYKQADELLPGGVFSPQELDDLVFSGLKTAKNFEPSSEIGKEAGTITKGVKEKIGGRSLTDTMEGKAGKKLSANDTWDFIKYLDDLSRKYERSSEPAFASHADDLATTATTLRSALGDRIKSASPELSETINKASSLYRNLSTAEGALRDQIIRGTSQNRSIPRRTLTEAVGDLLPSTPLRLGAAKAKRGASKALGVGASIAKPAGIIGMTQGAR